MRRDAVVDPLTVLRRSWPLVLACGFLGAALVAGGVALLPTTWRSDAVLRVVQQRGSSTTGTPDPTLEDPARFLATQRDLVLSDDVVRQVATALGLSADDVRARTTVTAGAVADTLTVTGQAGDAAAAQALARSVSETYQSLSASTGKDALSAQIANNQQALATLQAQAGNAALPKFQQTAAQTQFQDLSRAQAALTAARDSFTGPAQVVSGARLPTAPSSLGPTKTGAIGLVLGLLAGAGLALLRATRRERLTWVSDIVTTAGLPLLAEVPFAPSLAGGASRLRLVPVEDGPVVEAARGLAVALTADRSNRCVLVTSTGRYDGKTTVAGQLAVATARAGLRTILVAADVRSRAALPEVAADQPGLTDLLPRTTEITPDQLQTCCAPTATPNLQVVPIGTFPERGPDLLRGPRLAAVLAALAGSCDLVVLDGPAVSVPETATLAAASDGVVLCVGTHDAQRSVIRDTVAALRSVGTLLGLVVVDVEDRVRPEHSDYVAETPVVPRVGTPPVGARGSTHAVEPTSADVSPVAGPEAGPPPTTVQPVDWPPPREGPRPLEVGRTTGAVEPEEARAAQSGGDANEAARRLQEAGRPAEDHQESMPAQHAAVDPARSAFG